MAAKLFGALAGAGAVGLAAGTAAGAVIPVSSYSYATSPSAYVDSGGELTDGAWAEGINPADMWVGWDGGYAAVVFDLGSVHTVRGVDVAFCKWGNAAVYAPDLVRFVFSDTPDFAVSTSVDFVSALDPSHGGLTEVRSHDLSAGFNARYVRLEADHDRQWLFIGEVSFSPVPAPGAAGLLGAALLAAGRRRR